MNMFLNADTRILDIGGTIIIITLFKAEIDRYRVFVDGVMKGYLIEEDGFLVAADRMNISPLFLLRINEFAKGYSYLPAAV
ncbi:hypothetical protein [Pedobacter rhodius]|uniref:Uncharacterized protein n=1 Tax=Pedobacter rhodius TaxID=3004098 RepID=A0ABT4L1V8_9SPHI|nr:hypothetical protein [Pedobacter sp. SJ11]MCZ4225168.1 hypothetical protein [Pedobacter sp. SJ11]